MTRYQELADDIEASIAAGVLRAGDKLPSVRHTSERRGVSASTVFQAYYLLEARGLVRARALGLLRRGAAAQRPARAHAAVGPRASALPWSM